MKVLRKYPIYWGIFVLKFLLRQDIDLSLIFDVLCSCTAAWSAVRTHIRLSFLEIASADRAATQNKKLSEINQKVFCFVVARTENHF